ncbi:MAG: branched-chain amino acid transaminase [Chloroflexi bacterium]|nr:branched-chain amino acid transaminase [Chloroflexota bacterium]
MPVPKSIFIWMDGHFIEWERATVHVATHALHYGSSAFEGVRAYTTPQGPALFCLDPHVERLFNSCKMYKMPIPYLPAQIRDAIVETVRINELQSCYVRPLVFRGAENFSLDPRKCPVQVVIFAFPWGRYLGPEAIEKGVDVGVSSWRRMATGTFPALGKIGGQYINSQLVAMEASDHGYVEGIALDVNGYVSEGSGENIFVISNGIIYTPPLAASILQGITRTVAIALAREFGYSVVEQNIPREMLYVADEVFFTGTAAEITPVRTIDHVPVGKGERGPITKKLQDKFFAIVEGRDKDRHGWLTYTNGHLSVANVQSKAIVTA